MDLNHAALAVPAFFIFLGLEFYILKRKKSIHFYKWEDSIANVSVGVAERLLTLFISGSFYGLFTYVYDHYSLMQIPNHPLVWLGLLLFTDLVWYWYHRLGHEINILWGAHIVHHQSEEFNYTVSARITVFQALIRNLFWCVLPFVGFAPYMVLTILVVHGTYSFFTHTRMVGKLGWLEYFFITPSHHRVHHASNEHYLNKNYGDIFIFWDKLFGTFQEEKEEAVFGLTHPIKSYSFIWQHVHYFAELAEAARRTHGWPAKLKLLFGKPELLDQTIRTDLEKIFLPYKNTAKPTFRFKVYLTVQVVVVNLVLFFVILCYSYVSEIALFLIAGILLVSLVNCGALLEQRRWIYFVEYVRLVLIFALVGLWLGSISFFLLALMAFLLVELLLPLKTWYMRFVYDG